MSISYVEVKTKCVLWRNIELPHPDKSLESPVFYLDELSWYFKVNSYYYNSNLGQCFSITMECSDNTRLSNHIVTPYAETKDGFVRIIPKIKDFSISRSTLSQIIGSDRDTITVLFYISEHSLCTEQNFKETPLVTTKENDDSDKESIQTVCFKSLSEDIGKLFNDMESADTTLKCDDKSFSVHRKILAARSEVFSAMFEHDLSEKNTGVVDIVDMNSDVLEQFLRYLYSGKIEQMSMDVALELYQAAEKYSICTLKKLCASYILDNMSADIVYDVLILANKTGDVEFMDGITSFAVKIEGFLTSTEWKEFVKKFPNVAVEVYLKYHN